MKKFLLLLWLMVAPLGLMGCSQGVFGNPELEVTPALTPILLESPSTAEGAQPTGANPVHPAILGSPQGERTPVVIKVPRTPVVVAMTTPIAPSLNPTLPPTPEQPANPPTAAGPTPTPFPTTAQPQEPLATPIPGNPEPPPSAEQESTGVPVSLDETLNILVVGSDERRPGQPWRSDVIMVVAVDFAHRQVGVISFPRDLYVDIPTVGENRINTATFFGGINRYKNGGDIGLLKDTLAQNFGIRIDHYVKFNFETFKDIIDALGGIDIVVDCPITGRFPVEEGSKQLKWQTLEPGKYHMDGEFALRYVRERKTTSDVDRNRRQQRVLIAMRKRAQEVNILPRIPALYQAMRDNIETDLGLTDIIGLARLGLQIDPKDVHGFNIGFKETKSWRTPGGAMVLLPKMDKINEGIQNLFTKPSILKNPQKPANCR